MVRTPNLDRLSVALVACLVALAAALLPEPAAADPSDADLKQSLTQALAERGIEVENISSCSPKGGGTYICRWRADGFFPGEVPYLCVGRSRYNAKSNQWNIGGCHNRLEPQVPLLPEAGPRPAFGYSEDWLRNPAKLGALASGGGTVARAGMLWEGVEVSPGYFEWRGYDELYQRMLSLGIRPLWVLYAAPCWAQSNPQKCEGGKDKVHPSRDNYGALASFGAMVAQRYPQAIAIEVWNEANWKVFWGDEPDPTAYGEMVKAVAPAIHAANPAMPVITAGLSPHITTKRSVIAYRKFLRRAYATGGPQLADAIGAHPYPSRLHHQDFLGNVRAHLHRYRAVMAANGDAGKPIWVTEVGITTAGTKAYSPDQQADALSKIYTLLRRIENVPVVIFHRFLDDGNSGAPNEHGYGVLDANGDPKPAYCAVAEAVGVTCG
jgi:hypothetical protein